MTSVKNVKSVKGVSAVKTVKAVTPAKAVIPVKTVAAGAPRTAAVAPAKPSKASVIEKIVELLRSL